MHFKGFLNVMTKRVNERRRENKIYHMIYSVVCDFFNHCHGHKIDFFPQYYLVIKIIVFNISQFFWLLLLLLMFMQRDTILTKPSIFLSVRLQNWKKKKLDWRSKSKTTEREKISVSLIYVWWLLILRWVKLDL